MLPLSCLARSQDTRPTSAVGSRFQCAALAGCLLFGAISGKAQPQVRQVLMLQSLDRGNLIIDDFTGNFRVDLDQRAGRPVNVVQIVVGPTGFVGAPEQSVVDYIRSMFVGRPRPELIVSITGPAAVFARKHRQELFPDTPLLFAAVDERYLRAAPPGTNETAVMVNNDFPGLVDDILKLLPRTKQVFMVLGSGQIGRFWRTQLEDDFKRFHERLTFIWSNDLSLQEILRRCANLPPDSAIIYLTFGTDALGGAYADERVLAELHARANAPLFATHSSYFGYGIVGGRLMAMDDLSRNTADVAARILNGAPPASVTVPSQRLGTAVFDWRELQRWGIPESRLPSGSVVRYRSPSLWEKYKLLVLAATGVLIVQSLLIIGLLYQRRARQRAELESRRNLELAADARHRKTMVALSSAIVSEISQPLDSMMYNTRALESLIADQAPPDEIREILSEIEEQGVRAGQIIHRHRAMFVSKSLNGQENDRPSLRDI